MSSRRLLACAIAVVAVIAVGLLLGPQLRGLAFVVREAGLQGPLRALANLDARAVTDRRIDIPTPAGAVLAGRLYSPSGRSTRMAILVSGLHPAGIDEPRLTGLARQLAAAGLTILTPDIPELARFDVRPSVTDEVEAVALWLSDLSGRSDLSARDRRIGLLGISFSGGLALVAAGRPSLRDRVAYVFSLGGHDDLPRVLRYLCTGVEPPPAQRLQLNPVATPESEQSQGVRPPHDYGVAVMLLGVADRLVPPRQVSALRSAVMRFLVASTVERVDKQKAGEEFAALRSLAPTLPEPSATLLRYVNSRDIVHLGARLLPYIEHYGGAAALSPSKSPKPVAPVFLLHGRDDNVIPAMEAEYLAADLRGTAPVRVLTSDLISHAALDRQPRLTEVFELASFWGALLAQ